ncbi:MAG: GAF domain-containing protein [Anaerolineales bacterium]|nr:GAF domain-containing protein [Anaerolineales bacterium]
METAGEQSSPPVEQAWDILDLVNAALSTRTLEGLSDVLLPGIIEITRSSAACLYIPGLRSSGPCFFPSGFTSDVAAEVEGLCAEQYSRISDRPDRGSFDYPLASSPYSKTDLILFPMWSGSDCLGFIGVTADQSGPSASIETLGRLAGILANLIHRRLERAELERQLSQLNAYLTVSSSLSQSMDLHELLEISLYCCMEAVPAEAGSILLLDDEKKNFLFYEVQGAAKPLLQSATFPADRGIAGSVLKNQAAEIINDISQDPRFYGRVDSESGFRTRNMIAIPLMAGEEQVGVMELLNKAGGGPFLEQELLLLTPLAEEVAFAIRNARVFEYVVNTYCKQRQGLMTCKDCQRPLGTWTPCVRYRDVSLWMDGLSPDDTLTMPRSQL